MVGTCANCSERFRTLRSGKLFVVEAAADRESIAPPGRQPIFAPIPSRILYWLCEACAKTMRVLHNRRSGVRVEVLPVAADHIQVVAADKNASNKEVA